MQDESEMVRPLLLKKCKQYSQLTTIRLRNGFRSVTILSITQGEAAKMVQYHSLLTYREKWHKGIVSRDFLTLVYFMGQFLPSPRVLY
jgi:hypothetical protein